MFLDWDQHYDQHCGLGLKLSVAVPTKMTSFDSIKHPIWSHAVLE
jgi:hypothetical protein